MTAHRKDVKARTRGPAAPNPRHRREIELEFVSATFPFNPTPEQTEYADTDDDANSDSRPNRAG